MVGKGDIVQGDQSFFVLGGLIVTTFLLGGSTGTSFVLGGLTVHVTEFGW